MLQTGKVEKLSPFSDAYPESARSGKVQEGSPTTALTGHVLQLLLGNPETFPGQIR